jgi:hypothetical protein
MANNILLYNITDTDIDIDELGITVETLSLNDISHFSLPVISAANTLVDAVNTGNIVLVANSLSSPMDFWAIPEALSILQNGINSYQVGLQKANHPGIVPGQYYSALQSETLLASNVIVTSHLYATAVAFMAVNFNRIGIEVLSPVANGMIQLGVYDNQNGQPGNLILDAGYITTDTVGNKEIAITFQSPLDWYWLCALPSANVACQTITALSSSLTGTINGNPQDFANSVTFGPLPSVFPPLDPSFENPPVVWLRIV